MDSEPPKSKVVVVLPGVADAIDYVKKLSVIPKDAKTHELLKGNITNYRVYPPSWIDPKSVPINQSESIREWVSNWETRGRQLSVHVLVTGSIHLVGRALDVLESQDKA